MFTVQPKHSRGPKSERIVRVGRVVATVLLPWLAASFLFKPRIGPRRNDRILDRITFWRSVVGAAVILIATYRYQSASDVWNNTYEKATQTGRLGVLLLPLPFLVMLIVTRSGHRTQLLSGALRLLGRTVLALAFYFLPVVLFLAAAGELSLGNLANSEVEFHRDIDLNATGAAALWIVIAIVLVIILVPWYGCFWYCTIYWATRTGFWMGEIHPLLAPIVTTILMLLVTGWEIIGFDTNGVPNPLWLSLNLCGTASALVLSVVEYRHLRSIGYQFRGGPHPVNVD